MTAMLLLACMVRKATFLGVCLIVVAFMLVVSEANQSNSVVAALQDAGSWLATPFHDVFDLGAAKANVAVNGAFAALAYAIGGGMVRRFLVGAVSRGRTNVRVC